MPKPSKTLFIIGGATASGKTAAALRLAEYFKTEILSADSRQFYREMRIGTAKPSPEELAAVRHHFIDSLSITDHYSVGDFERDALAILETLYERVDSAVLVGGSGLFLEAVSAGLDQFPAVSQEVKMQVAAGEKAGGLEWLQLQLSALDPAYFQRVDQQNPARLRRALEVCLASGQPYSAYLSRPKPRRPFTPVFMLLEWPRQELYTRIDARVDSMLEAGLEQEARQLYPYKHVPALRTVGYEEWWPYFEGDASREEVVEKIKQHSRNYAKRQATWFRKHGAWQAFHPAEQESMLRYCQQELGRISGGGQ
ncbi:MAG: tRNA (adenosine(37)-N6)-dimethylallyltransferase MiaA [Saprospiraceae bacterium]|nr:tRNA (adenosine(37)-N6)-dimethylallyltransferase MiaA [Saprospiraceae bacterium]